jgi:hypothetical protein
MNKANCCGLNRGSVARKAKLTTADGHVEIRSTEDKNNGQQFEIIVVNGGRNEQGSRT